MDTLDSAHHVCSDCHAISNTSCATNMPSSTRTVFSLIIINKAGGLIYQREYQAGLRSLSTNDYLVLAGTFHGYDHPTPWKLSVNR